MLGQGEQRKQDQNIRLEEKESKGGNRRCLRNQKKKSTYKKVSKARESKIPGSSSVRSLSSIPLKATRDEIDQIVRAGSTSRPIAHHY